MADVSMATEVADVNTTLCLDNATPLKTIWLVEHQKDRVWKQFPEGLAFFVEQAHILTLKYIYTHTHTHVKRGLPEVAVE